MISPLRCLFVPLSQCRGRGLMRANAESLLLIHPNFFSHNICKLTPNLEKMSNIELYIHLDKSQLVRCPLFKIQDAMYVFKIDFFSLDMS